MAWTRHFQTVPRDQRLKAALAKSKNDNASPQAGGSGSKYSSYLPEVYAGSPQRVERYTQYDMMDQDSEVNAALDTIADFCTRQDDTTSSLFNIVYNGDPSDSEVEILNTLIKQWTSVNQFKKRLWRMFRNTIKYGDQFFIRDPETLKWHWVDHSKIEKVLVNEAEGKEPEQYLIRELDLNLQNLTATVSGSNQGSNGQLPSNVIDPNRWGGGSRYNSGGTFGGQQSATPVDATHVVHFSMSEGMDGNWPFGTSILEPVFKVFKQKELLEDSIVIYRVQRAPERRVFYVDVGGMPPHKAQPYLEKVKMEIHQRRIPTRTGGGTSIVDAAYNPLSIMEDYFFAQTSEGRGSKVETLPGGENLGQIDDLKYFNNKLIRGLRVPSSYLPTGPEDGQATFSDGRVGTAYIQEFRFANYCQRLQQLMATVFDDEFKLFLKQRGINIDASLFELEFNPPQNFRQFAQIERDAAQIGVFQPLSEVKYMSKRFLLKRYLGLSEDEIIENETMWVEENGDQAPEGSDAVGAAPGLDNIGFRAEPDDGSMDGMDEQPDIDLDGADDVDAGAASPISGDETASEE